MARRPLTTIAAILLTATALAQDRPVSPEPAFEVASVKVNPNDTVPEAIALQADGVRFTAFRVRTLMAMAYRSEGIQRFDQIVDGPSWIGIDRFDIVAKSGRDSNTQGAVTNQLPAMLRTLLRDRFRLRTHTATRRMPAYALVLARRDKRLGPQLRESTIACPPVGEPAGATIDPDRWCGIRATGLGMMTGRGASAALIAGNLSGHPAVDRFVTDRTGLSGRYDFQLEYSPAFVDGADPASNGGASLFTALTEQLGLKLQPESIALPVIVIDNIEKPTAD